MCIACLKDGSAVKPLDEAVVAWDDGKISITVGRGEPRGDLSVHQIGSSGVPGEVLAIMTVPMVGESVRFLGANGCEPPVQMFRYAGTDGIVRRFLACADCGTTMIVDMGELQRMVRVVCRKCGAAASRRGCPAWHSFGTCAACPVDAAVP